MPEGRRAERWTEEVKGVKRPQLPVYKVKNYQGCGVHRGYSVSDTLKTL